VASLLSTADAVDEVLALCGTAAVRTPA
jgi:hypothetical protein